MSKPIDQECAKCGSSAKQMTLIRPGTRLGDRSFADGEWIRCNCMCGYQWDTACADAKPTSGEEGA